LESTNRKAWEGTPNLRQFQGNLTLKEGTIMIKNYLTDKEIKEEKKKKR